LGPLVARMLARDPAQRPSLDDIVRELTGSQPARRRRWPIAAVSALVAAGLAVAGWAAWRAIADDHAPAAAASPAAPAALTTASIAIAPLTIELPSYGREPADAAAIADTLARLLGQVDDARLTGLATAAAPGEARGAARALGAGYVVTGRIAERDHQLHAQLALIAVASGATVAAIELSRPLHHLAALLDDAAVALARSLAPAA